MPEETEILSIELLEGFLEKWKERGCSISTLQEYRRSLLFLNSSLPEGKALTKDTGVRWKQWLEGKGFSTRTVNARLAAWNGLAQYLGHREWQVGISAGRQENVQPELTRTEYLRLLSAAKRLGQERNYLLIKTLGSAGLKLQELPMLTAEAVRQGRLRLGKQGGPGARILHLPETLQRELEGYISRNGIEKGPVFVTARGNPLDRSNILHCMKRISYEAGVPAKKVNPRCLWNMYQAAWEGIWSGVLLLAEQAYGRLLEQEQLETGWEDV